MSCFRFFLLPAVIAAAVMTAGFVPSAHATDDSKHAEESCGEFGTSVEFVDSPAEAAKQALKEEKLVFVLHVSGNFETPDYT